ncbi:putative GNAT family N-acyltransferase [Pontibacter mucosus]|uniref:Putative GNAT family N-acyltransferase n=1 Tax=Pontibacter mucosus TaxID=1649266 RepID=A0A2T5YQ14_9BACT|nr:GNAT family N-acetyltransferase [Pontibacter mucosus]PTX21394.1 putative GNAT family N-acyltransferase [Pontibacter mucosus]
MQIKEITAEETWQLRRDVMWPEKDISYVQLPEDEDGHHFGLYLSGELVSVVSLFVAGQRAQFRKFATLPQYQGKGYGSMLLQHLIRQAATQGITQLWCNARQEKASFYRRFGLQETNHTFMKDGKSYVVMEGSIAIPAESGSADK